MENLLSSVIVQVFTEDLEETIVTVIDYLVFYGIYEDYLYIRIQNIKTDEILKQFNSYHRKKFHTKKNKTK